MPRPPSDCPLPAVTSHTPKRGAPAFPYLFPPPGAPGMLCPIAAVSARTRRKTKCRYPPPSAQARLLMPLLFSGPYCLHTVLSARRRALPRPSTRPLDRPPLQPPLPHQAKQLPHLSVLIGRQKPCDRSPSNIGASPQHHPTPPQHHSNADPTTPRPPPQQFSGAKKISSFPPCCAPRRRHTQICPSLYPQRTHARTPAAARTSPRKKQPPLRSRSWRLSSVLYSFLKYSKNCPQTVAVRAKF